ncbi:glutamine cyclotransferase [Flavobacterium branchiophilum NBRC 15030 = ATCC 35035]|uniref:Glutamine cyclotransferase n=1 Tax=Flavobacterium branchiophilum TaxID=55197 RepID=A0A543G7I7_9FLAO|nr:glutaminyl-peptide cyclotransferase [Flavobacterium branchiophilum]OXA74697.1 glutamine cyclotransferase [Flavobacterium branchiophilum NBRC 15030 = ATCC 35035]TQM41914.1 glutamine cyclotransferase [Flavobacterium branchiophilum]GEM55392.1 glutamine cyclotransferase [Flavobacterium branchiophilum NBRC 15030 = ATCC 35035]
MKNYKLLYYSILTVFLLGLYSCNSTKENMFSFDKKSFKSQYTRNESMQIGIENPENKAIDSIIFYLNEKNIGAQKGAGAFKFELKNQILGLQDVKALVYFEGKNQEIVSKIEIVSSIEPQLLNYKIVNTFPHDTTSFTEGFEFYGNDLYEGTGQKGTSRLLKTQYQTGKIVDYIKLDNQYFGEGITILKDKVYQLTWQDKLGFIYDLKTWKLEKTFPFDQNIEGWGLTNDGTHLYQSDGTARIWTMDAATQKMVSHINVYSGSTKIESLNELEWMNGKLLANIWHKDAIVVIDPNSGAVEGIVDLSALHQKIKSKSEEAVLNGIAFKKSTNTIFVTGKNWDKTFEITLQ